MLESLKRPDFRPYAVGLPQPSLVEAESTRMLRGVFRDVMQRNPDGRLMEPLSEHLYQGRLEGSQLTGRHDFFLSDEALIQIVSSMFNQHAKWIEASREVPWRRPVETST